MFNSSAGSRPIELLSTIASGQSLSDIVDVGSKTLLGIIMPSAWTAANLTIQVSTDGTNFYDVYDGLGTEKTITAAANRYIIIDPTDFVGAKYIKVRSGTAAAAVNQGADRAVRLITKVI
jgi:hypothetical protein